MKYTLPNWLQFNAVGVILFYCLSLVTGYRYLMYFSLIFSIPTFVRQVIIPAERNLYFQFITSVFVLIIINLLTTLIIYYDVGSRFFEIAIFLINPILGASLLISGFSSSALRKFINFLFGIVIISYFLNIDSGALLSLLSIDTLLNSLTSSSLDTESGLSFLFALFAIFFFITNQKSKYLLSFFLCLISFKRIAILALILSLLLYRFYLSRYQTISKRISFSSIILINLFFIFITFLISYSIFVDDITMSVFGIGINQLTMGRSSIYQTVFEYSGGLSLWGIGLGSSERLLAKNFEPDVIALLHSDILKSYFEMGLLLFIYWMYNLSKIFSVNAKTLILFVTINIVFFTDNTLMYNEFMLIFYLMIGVIAKEQHELKPFVV